MAKPVKKKLLLARPGNAKKHLPQPKPSRGKRRMGDEITFDPTAQFTKRAPSTPLPAALSLHASPDVLNRLWAIIDSRKLADPEISHSARLLAKGSSRVAQKLGEEAVECLIEVVSGNRAGIVAESADVLYHLLIAWVHSGIQPEEIWQELQHRENISHLTEGPAGPLKRLLGSVQAGTRKIP